MPVPTGPGAHRISKSNHPIPNPGMLASQAAAKHAINNPSTHEKEKTSVITPQRHRNLNTYNVANARVPAGARVAPYGVRKGPVVVRPTPRVSRGSATSSNGSMNGYPEHVKAILREGMKEFERERRGGSEEVEIMPPHLLNAPVITPEQFALGLKALEDPEEDFPKMEVEIPSSMPTLNAYDNGLSSNGGNRSVHSSYTPPGTPTPVNRPPYHQQSVARSESVASSVIGAYIPGYQAPPSSEVSSPQSVRSVSVTSSAYGSNINHYAPPASEASSRHSVLSESRVSSVFDARFQDHRSEASSRHSANINSYRERSRSPARSHHSHAFSGLTPSRSPIRSHASNASSFHSAFRSPARNHVSRAASIHSASRSPVRSHGSRASSVHSAAGRRSLSPDAHSFQPRHRYRTRSNSNAARAAAVAADAAGLAGRSLTGNDPILVGGEDLEDSDSELFDLSDSEVDVEGYEESPQVNERLFRRRGGLERL
jgi:hypothetical protein